MSLSLRGMGIEQPSPIQAASLTAINSGLSCILHAETGSGKTLAYLLPALKRILRTPEDASKPVQVMIIVPSKELAVQVAADVAALMAAGTPVSPKHCAFVHLCISSSTSRARSGGLNGITAPIVIGTPYHLLDAVLGSSPQTLGSLSYLVLDEVDRLVGVLSKYATGEDRRVERRAKMGGAGSDGKPVEQLLSILVRLRALGVAKGPAIGAGDDAAAGASLDGARGGLQLVAASATISRALRRELHRLLQGGGLVAANVGVGGVGGVEGSYNGGGGEQGLLVLRAAPSTQVNAKTSYSRNSDSDSTTPSSTGTNAADVDSTISASGFTRFVGLPRALKHRAIIVQDAVSIPPVPARQARALRPSSPGRTPARNVEQEAEAQAEAERERARERDLSAKLASAKKVWIDSVAASASASASVPAPSSAGSRSILAAKLAAGARARGAGVGAQLKGLLFVPPGSSVQQVVNMLRFWTVPGVVSLDQFLGLEAGPEAGSGTGSGTGTGTGSSHRGGEELVLAAVSRLGVAASAAPSPSPQQPQQQPQTQGGKQEPAGCVLVVAPQSASRGLHLPDISIVFLLQPPATMDEYLHMAGRAGRMSGTSATTRAEGAASGAGSGLSVSAGEVMSPTVLSLVGYDELVRLQSWQTPLGITFDVEYER